MNEKYKLYARLFVTGEVVYDLKLQPFKDEQQICLVTLAIDDSDLRFKFILYNKDAIHAITRYRKGDVLNCILIPFKPKEDTEIFYKVQNIERMER